MAFDVGSVRIGVARCDASATLCLPVATIATYEEALELITEYSPMELLVGLPISLDGVERAAAVRAREWARGLAERCAIPIRLIDERMTSTTAGRELSSAGLSTRQQRNVVDQAAAVIMLETALETERRTQEPGGVAL